MKFLLFVLVLTVIVWLAMSLYRGRHVRSVTRQTATLPPFPQPPTELTGPSGAALLPAAGGTYLGTSMAGDWNDQVTVGDIGRQTPATLHLSRAGLLLDRRGASPLWIRATAVRGARTGRAVSGRVLTDDGLLIVTWQLGGHLLDSGFRGEPEVYPNWVQTLRALARGPEPTESADPAEQYAETVEPEEATWHPSQPRFPQEDPDLNGGRAQERRPDHEPQERDPG